MSELKIGFIGAGKVAAALGRYLSGHGVKIGGYLDHTAEKSAAAAEWTGGRAYSDPDGLAHDCSVILIATQDDRISTACEDLVSTGKIGSDHLVGHLSGAHTSLILDAAARAGAGVFSLHPLQSFANEERAVANMTQTFFTLEGRDPRLDSIERMLRKAGNPCLRIDPAGKTFYHLSACIVSNYLVTLMAHAMEALSYSGIEERQGFQALLPLIHGTIANIAQFGPAEALTGPVARGDVSTVSLHLEALESRGLTRLREIYTYLGLRTLELSRRNSLGGSPGIEAVEQVLKRFQGGGLPRRSVPCGPSSTAAAGKPEGGRGKD